MDKVLKIKSKNTEDYFLIDESDFKKVSTKKWSVYSNGRNKKYVRTDNTYLHRFLLEPKKGFEVDHIDGNTLNNTRKNLRIATPSQNQANAKGRGKTSEFKGVSFSKRKNKWSAIVHCNGKVFRLGMFLCEEEAALAYNKKAKELWGEFAYQNTVRNLRKPESRCLPYKNKRLGG